MYSRYPNYRFSGGVKIPDNYSGNAFKPSDAEEDMDVAESVGINESDTESEESLAVAERAEKAGDVAASCTPRRSPFGGLKFNVGRMFSGGIGFEELLILGLIIMLSRNENESDIVLLLGLLLFCG